MIRNQPQVVKYRLFFCIALFLYGLTGCGNTENSIKEIKDAEDIEVISELFPDPHGELPALEAKEDLDEDGKNEKIMLSNLGYNGGDGGYELHIYRIIDGKEVEIELPRDYIKERGFPFYTKWDSNGVEILLNEKSIQTISGQRIREIYKEKNLEEVFPWLDRAETIEGDAISGFTIIADCDDSKVLATKSYLMGKGGHSDTLGYGIAKLKLKKDDTWDVEYDFRLDDTKNE